MMGACINEHAITTKSQMREKSVILIITAKLKPFIETHQSMNKPFLFSLSYQEIPVQIIFFLDFHQELMSYSR